MTREQLKIGIPKIVKNAEDLYQDADFLFSNNRLERAYTLFQLSIEEIAKAFILANALIFDDLASQEASVKLEKEIRDHEFKSTKSISIDSFIYNILKEINPDIYEKVVFDSIKEYKQIKELNKKKNDSLYVGFVGNKFISPKESIRSEDVKTIKIKAGLRIYVGTGIIMGIVKNAELFREQMKEYLKTTPDDSKERIKEYTRIIQKHEKT